MSLIALLIAATRTVFRNNPIENGTRREQVMKMWGKMISRIPTFFVRSHDNFYSSSIACLLGFLWTFIVSQNLLQMNILELLLSFEIAIIFSYIACFKMCLNYIGSPFKLMSKVYFATMVILSLTPIQRLTNLQSGYNISSNFIAGEYLPLESFGAIILIYLIIFIKLIYTKYGSVKCHTLSKDIDFVIQINLQSKKSGDDDDSPCSMSSSGSTASIASTHTFLVQSGGKIQLVVVSSNPKQQSTNIKVKSPKLNPFTLKEGFAPPLSPINFTQQTDQHMNKRSKLHEQQTAERNESKISSSILFSNNMILGIKSEPKLIEHKEVSTIEFPKEVEYFSGSPSFQVIQELILPLEEGKKFPFLTSFDERSNTMMVVTDSAISFYAVPTFQFKKTVLFRMDKFIAHRDNPICLQYIEYVKNLKFVRLELFSSKKSVAQPRNQSYQFKEEKLENAQSNLLFFGSFAPTQNEKPVETAIIRDGTDLIAVDVMDPSIEVIYQKLPSNPLTPVKVEQLNGRSILVTIGEEINIGEFQRFAIDIPTNICFKDYQDLSCEVSVIPIRNLSGKVILNYKKSALNPRIFDSTIKKSITIPGARIISNPLFIEGKLYFLDEKKRFKVVSLTDSKLNLTVVNEGLPCTVSLAML